jgi:hypothetical protein
VTAAGRERPRDIIAASRSNDQRLGARAHCVRESLTLAKQPRPVSVRKAVGPVICCDPSGGVRIDANEPVGAAIGIAILDHPHTRKAVPRGEAFFGDALTFSPMHIEPLGLAIDDEHGHH